MNKLLTMSALAALLSVATMAEANAWTRSGTVTHTGPRGNSVTRSGTVGCVGRVCAGKTTVTGPRGNSVTRAGVSTRGRYYYPPRPVVYAPVVYPRPTYYARYYYGAGYYAPYPYRLAYYRPY